MFSCDEHELQNDRVTGSQQIGGSPGHWVTGSIAPRYVKERRKTCCGLPCTDKGRESKTVPYDKITDCDVQEIRLFGMGIHLVD